MSTFATHEKNWLIDLRDFTQRNESNFNEAILTEDYRFGIYQKLVMNPKFHSHFTIDLTNQTIDSIENHGLPLDDILPSNETCHIHIYLCCFGRDYRLLLKSIKQICNVLNQQNIKISFFEDLFLVERPFIYQSKETNFLKHFKNISIEYRHVEIEIINTNEFNNLWGEGDSFMVEIPEIKQNINYFWERIHNEIFFQEMFNLGNAVPRLISIQSTSNVIGKPLYRHPNDEEPENIEMIPLVKELVELVEKHTNISGLNHVLIQHYRDGRDNIAAHSDKTLDIDLNTPIINLSFGVTRQMFLQNKQNKQILEQIPLISGTALVFGLISNKYWYHEVPKDVTIKPNDLFGTSRVSFTFRKINTFVTPENIIVGQGSPYKTLEDIGHVEPPINQTRADLIQAFSKENRLGEGFDWETYYGKGFLVF